MPAAKDPPRLLALEHGRSAFNAQEGSFAQSHHRQIVFLEELLNALLLRFAHMRRGWIRIQVVWTDLEVDQPERFKRGWLDHRHVLGRLEGGTGHDRPGARADVRNPSRDLRAKGAPDTRIVEGVQKSKGVSASDETAT